jgi:hypothetical protein
MNLFEASKFYGDYSLALELIREELSEDFDDGDISDEKILTCDESLNTL